MNSNGILHFTVNSKGWLRMHETSQDAVAMKQADEVVVYLALTRTQIATILKAESVARTKPVDEGPRNRVRRQPPIPGDDRLD